MEIDRRGFIKVAGLITAGMALKPVLDALTIVKAPEAARAAQTLAGKRWAMVVTPRKCEERCKDCIEACYRTHNVPHIEDPKHEVKWIWAATFEEAFPGQEHEFLKEYVKDLPIPLLCNHCENPPCVKVCPVQATWKREDGIVMMDFHRCIGCRYCMAACPYGARSFNWTDPRPFIKELNQDFPTRTKGVVEKCNFCEERLAKGLVPACVEACKDKALVFGNLEEPTSEVRKILASHYTIRRKPELGTEPNVYYVV